MEIHQLKYFICVAKLESISKAATMLHLSQPALSKSLAKLEDELGVQLFDRLGKRLHLNDRGKLFLKGAEKALRELDGAAASVSAGAGSLQGSLSVGVFGVQDSAISCVQRFMQANRRSARHTRRPATLDHGPRRARVRHGVLSRRARVRGHCRHSLRTQPRTAGSSSPPPPGSRQNRRPCPIQGRPLRLHEHHGRRVRAKLPALRRKRLYALGARGDEQRHGSATAHRRRTGSRVRRRPKLSAGRTHGRRRTARHAFRRRRRLPRLARRRFPLAAQQARHREAKPQPGSSRRARGRTRLLSQKPLPRSRRIDGSAFSNCAAARPSKPSASPVAPSTCSRPLPANSSLSCCNTSPCPTTTAWPFASRATEPAQPVGTLAGKRRSGARGAWRPRASLMDVAVRRHPRGRGSFPAI